MREMSAGSEYSYDKLSPYGFTKYQDPMQQMEPFFCMWVWRGTPTPSEHGLWWDLSCPPLRAILQKWPHQRKWAYQEKFSVRYRIIIPFIAGLKVFLFPPCTAHIKIFNVHSNHHYKNYKYIWINWASPVKLAHRCWMLNQYFSRNSLLFHLLVCRLNSIVSSP